MDVTLLERRRDLRSADISAGRSINLALSTRGLTALKGVGLADEMTALSLPMSGRLVHSPEGEISRQPYGLAGQAILSVSRRDLNVRLMDAAEEAGAQIHFERACVAVDLDASSVTVEGPDGEREVFASDVVIGADGAFSVVRGELQRAGRFDYQQAYLTHGYKELCIPAGADGGGHRIDPSGLHIWPRHSFMLIALPNLDGTFTCTLFLPFEGEASFEKLTTPAAVESFFAREFPDVAAHMPTLTQDFFENPTGSLVTVRCSPYHRGSTVLIGDAAHAVVPFYGQGMNAAFEDCTVLNRLLQEHGDDWEIVLPAFSRERKVDADAIADLAIYNYLVMRDKVASPGFLLRKKLDRLLHGWMPNRWAPLYSRVTFSNRPYSEARRAVQAQDALLRRALWGALLGFVLALAGVVWCVAF
jgi:kynurenine 3-monooxygenase